MKYSYYPGCTLKTKAKELNDYAIASAKALGIEMEEIEDWQCCGGVYSTATDEIANKLSSVRALAQARDKGQDLLTLRRYLRLMPSLPDGIPHQTSLLSKILTVHRLPSRKYSPCMPS